MPRSETAKLLLKEERHGAVIVCALAPYENWEVTYAPRSKTDREPWVIAGTIRYSGAECRAVTRDWLEAWAEAQG